MNKNRMLAFSIDCKTWKSACGCAEIIEIDSWTMQNTSSDTNTLLENLPQVLKDKFELDTKIAESLWIAFVYRKVGFVLSFA